MSDTHDQCAAIELTGLSLTPEAQWRHLRSYLKLAGY